MHIAWEVLCTNTLDLLDMIFELEHRMAFLYRLRRFCVERELTHL